MFVWMCVEKWHNDSPRDKYGVTSNPETIPEQDMRALKASKFQETLEHSTTRSLSSSRIFICEWGMSSSCHGEKGQKR